MSFFKDYFTFSKKERGGIISLLVLMMVSIGIYVLSLNYSNTKKYDYSQFKADIDKFHSDDNKYQNVASNHTYEKKSKNHKVNFKNQLFHFNPNTISQDSLELLGVFPNVSQRIIKYRNAGGKFKSQDDLLKIYGFSDKLYQKLKPFIDIDSEIPNKSEEFSESKKAEKKKILKINLNTADTNELKSLNGIGSKLSVRIVNFRENAGGFYSIDQLKDIYGLKPETIEKIKDQVYIDEQIRKININTVTAEELKKHPYINKWNIANAIVNYRAKHGNYKQASDLMKTDLVSEDLYRKIAPYLIFE